MGRDLNTLVWIFGNIFSYVKKRVVLPITYRTQCSVEVDYVINWNGEIYSIEVKANNSGAIKICISLLNREAQVVECE